MWECTGGSVCKGEDSLTGALREELGLTLCPGDGRLVRLSVKNQVGGVRFADILDVWLFSYSCLVDLGRAETDEVAQAGWMTRDRICSLYDAGQLVYTLFFEEKML